ncbi:GNAT family N-acetyltransferase [Bacillus sp. ISL-40]|uniref:GNAT family N-acetyltransferase n=1 Tax=unclassified Bacillus (in: firmicutes) TaxID=185979 RepID=UPI001BEAAAD2|nr:MULTISPECIES: GNAT family N-acetyltransferase [unclassified Bacillus (in: firmicutes)]MBT2701222.1 GNAT family N-acetyltransferase [Bacillus sp. ISL-40]MBT2744595.1 GNAT family N-acetyltransferase [Bacillus sp. ISL-77]
MEIRQIKTIDAASFVNLIKQVESESAFMLLEKGERNIGPEQQEKRIEDMKKEDNSTIFVAEENNELIGYLIAIGGNARRNKHSVYLVIGILNRYRGLGIGTKLFKQLEEWATEHSIHRLELSVVTRNEAGLGLYKKMGFDIEGTKRQSLYIDGIFVDEYYMSKLL